MSVDKENLKVSDSEYYVNSYERISDHPIRRSQYGEGGYTAQEMKQRQMAPIQLLKNKLNALIDAIAADDEDSITQIMQTSVPDPTDPQNTLTVAGLLNLLAAGNADLLKVTDPFDAGEKATLRDVLEEMKSGASEIFWAEYGETTYNEIMAALSDHRLPICPYDDHWFIYRSIVNGKITFVTLERRGTLTASVDANDVWDHRHYDFFFTAEYGVTGYSELTQMVNESRLCVAKKDGRYYYYDTKTSGGVYRFAAVDESASGVKASFVELSSSGWSNHEKSGSGVFTAIHGTTTFNEVKTAANSGALVVCKRTSGNEVQYLMLHSLQSTYAEFSRVAGAANYLVRSRVDSSNNWNDVSHRVIFSINGKTSTDGTLTLTASDVGAAASADVETIKSKIPSAASSTNKLVSESQMGDAISAVEAKQLYATAAQGSFATKAALTAATTFYNADGTVATPTRNDVAYVLSDESHSGKSAKYVVASDTGNPVVWGFVITFSDATFTQAQMDAINSGVTAQKIESYDEHIEDDDLHTTAAEKVAWNAKQDAISDLDEIREGAELGATALQSNGDGSNATAAFTQASTRANISTGEKMSVIFGKIAKWFADLKAVAFSGSYNDLSNKPANVSAFNNDAGYLTSHQSLDEYRKAAAQDVIDAGKEASANKVTSISSASTDTQYPSAKAVYTYIASLDGNGVSY